jgi:DNA-binding winged helix-turn-helix (wHTH) protein
MLKLADLASRADFNAGPLHVSPSRRQVEGPAGSASVEPIVMKVFLLLLDAGGNVVTRDELFGNAWGGVFVGDDSLNRAIAQVRKIASETAPSLFEIETIPRTGYRLVGEIVECLERDRGRPKAAAGPIARRRLIGTGVAAIVAVGGAGAWLTVRDGSDAKFEQLLDEAHRSVRKGTADQRTIRTLENAVAIRPGSAQAWGLLAFLVSTQAQAADPKDAPRVIDQSENAARRALSLNAKEPNALLAMLELQGSTLDWTTRDQRLRQIITIDPRNLGAINELVPMLQAAGLNRESWNWNERALAIEPLSPIILGRRAMKLWIGGRVPESDKVIDQARALWPSNPWLWGVQFLILALSGRARAAEAMRDSDPAMAGPPVAGEMWRPSLVALEQRSPKAVAAARDACLKGAAIGAQLGGEAVMILSALGEVDAAFEVASGFLLSRGPIVRRGKRPFNAEFNNDAGWRINTQWLFVPATAAMRSDSRFLPLCEGVGLTQYWRSRGVRPDYQLSGR